MRLDKKVAGKYNLNPVEDKKLIKKIKKEQFLWTIPAIIPGIRLVAGAAVYLYNKYVAEPIDMHNIKNNTLQVF